MGFENSEKAQVKTQLGYPVANPKGQDRTGLDNNRGTSLSESQKKGGGGHVDRSDEVREMYESDLSDAERAHLEAKADRAIRDGYDR